MSDEHTPDTGDGSIGPDAGPAIGRRRGVRRDGVIAATSLAPVVAVVAAAVIAARGPMVHYADRSVADEGRVLDSQV
jgi:hypothetical protein